MGIWVSADVKFWSVNLTFFKHGFNINQATQITQHQRRDCNYNSKKWAINSLGDWATTHTHAHTCRATLLYIIQNYKMNRWMLHHKSSTHTHSLKRSHMIQQEFKTANAALEICALTNSWPSFKIKTNRENLASSVAKRCLYI